MTLTKWVAEYLKKFSFISDTQFKNGQITLFYEKEDTIKHKRIPIRATKAMLLKCIETIKEDINYYEDKAKRDVRLLEKMKNERIIFTSI